MLVVDRRIEVEGKEVEICGDVNDSGVFEVDFDLVNTSNSYARVGWSKPYKAFVKILSEIEDIVKTTNDIEMVTFIPSDEKLKTVYLKILDRKNIHYNLSMIGVNNKTTRVSFKLPKFNH